MTSLETLHGVCGGSVMAKRLGKSLTRKDEAFLPGVSLKWWGKRTQFPPTQILGKAWGFGSNPQLNYSHGFPLEFPWSLATWSFFWCCQWKIGKSRSCSKTFPLVSICIVEGKKKIILPIICLHANCFFFHLLIIKSTCFHFHFNHLHPKQKQSDVINFYNAPK